MLILLLDVQLCATLVLGNKESNNDNNQYNNSTYILRWELEVIVLIMFALVFVVLV